MAGPIHGCSDDEAYGWRRNVKTEFANHGIEVYDPLDRDFRGKETLSWKEIVENDLECIRKSDVVLANFWKAGRPYHGTSMELVYAKLYGVHVVSVYPVKTTQGFNPWVRYHSNLIVYTMDEAVEHILNMVKYMGW